MTITTLFTGLISAPAPYTHWRLAVNNARNITTTSIRTCEIEAGTRWVDYSHDDALGSAGGYITVDSIVYVVFPTLHVHNSFPNDVPGVLKDLPKGTEHADEGTQGETSPHTDLGVLATRDPATFERCYSDGTRNDDP